jgi:predicted PurR-regulated permease PerM
MNADPTPPTSDPSAERPDAAFARRVLIALALASLFAAVFLLLAYAPAALILAFAAVWFGCVLRHAAAGLSRKTGLSGGWTMSAVALLLVAAVLAFFALLGWQLAGHVNELADSLEKSWSQLLDRLDDYPQLRRLIRKPPSPEQAAQILGGKPSSTVATLLTSPFGFVVNVLFVFVTGLYLAGDSAKYVDGAVRLFPVARRPHVRRVFVEAGESLWRWTLARLAGMAIIGVLTGVGLALLGVPMAATLGILAALFEFIPNVGPIVASLPPLLLALSQGGWQWLYVLLLFLGIQLVESYLITPLIHQREDDLPAALTITAQLVLGILFGLLGVMFAMPIVLVAMLFVQRFYVERGLEGRTEGSSG